MDTVSFYGELMRSLARASQVSDFLGDAALLFQRITLFFNPQSFAINDKSVKIANYADTRFDVNCMAEKICPLPYFH